MAKDRKKIQHIHSSVFDKQPTPNSLEMGELAVNTNERGSFISTKNNNDEVVRFSEDATLIDWMEYKEVFPYEGNVTEPTAQDLEQNRAEITFKINQIVPSNTPHASNVNGAKDMHGDEINPLSGDTDGAGFAVDMSRFALISGNPTFNSMTINCGTTLKGTTNIFGASGDCGSMLNVDVDEFYGNADNICLDAESAATLYGSVSTKVGVDCTNSYTSTTTNVEGEKVIVNATQDNLGLTAKGDILESSEGDIVITADNNICESSGNKLSLFGFNETVIGIDCSGSETSQSVTVGGDVINIMGDDITNIVSPKVSVSNNLYVSGVTHLGGGLNSGLEWKYGVDARVASDDDTNFSDSEGTKTIGIPNSVSGLNRSTLTLVVNGVSNTYDPGLSSKTIEITSCNEPLIIENSSGETIGEYTPCSGGRIRIPDEKVELSAETLCWHYGKVPSSAIDDCYDISEHKDLYIPKTISDLNPSALTIHSGSTTIIYDGSEGKEINLPTGELTLQDNSGHTFGTYSPVEDTAITISAYSLTFSGSASGEYNPFEGGKTITIPEPYNEPLKFVNSGGTVVKTYYPSSETSVSGATIKFSGATNVVYDPFGESITVVIPTEGEPVQPCTGSYIIKDGYNHEFGSVEMCSGVNDEPIVISAFTLTIDDNGTTKYYNPFSGATEIEIPESYNEPLKFVDSDGTVVKTYYPSSETSVSGATIKFSGAVNTEYDPFGEGITINIPEQCSNEIDFNNRSGQTKFNYSPCDNTKTVVSGATIKFSGATNVVYDPFGENITVIIPTEGEPVQPCTGSYIIQDNHNHAFGKVEMCSGADDEPIVISAFTLTIDDNGTTKYYNPFSGDTSISIGMSCNEPLYISSGAGSSVSAYTPCNGGTISAGTLNLSICNQNVAYNPFDGTSEKTVNVSLGTMDIWYGKQEDYGSPSKTYSPCSDSTTKIAIPKSFYHLNEWNESCFELPNGNICMSGDVVARAFYTSSDERLKENINPLSDEDIEKASNVGFHSFVFKNDNEKKKTYGVIAQDVKAAGLDNIIYNNENGFMTVDYTSLLILKIAKMEKMIEELSNEIKELKK